MADTSTLRKTYSTAFVLDRGKLSRIMSILEQRMPEIGVPFEPVFALKLHNGKELSLHSVQEVLALDNAVKNPIVQMEIRVPSAKTSAGHVSVHYDRDRKSNVSIVVTGPNTKWATETFAEIEEQVQRSFSTNWIYRHVVGEPHFGWNLVVLLMAIAVGTVFLSLFNRPSTKPQHEPSVLLQRALDAKTQDEKLQIVFDNTVKDLANEVRRREIDSLDLRILLTWRAFFMALPIVLVVGALVYLVTTCYPWAVFSWGDWEQEYTELITRRKSVWNVIVASVVVGIISNMFVLSLPQMK